jgi:hypothetical protein
MNREPNADGYNGLRGINVSRSRRRRKRLLAGTQIQTCNAPYDIVLHIATRLLLLTSPSTPARKYLEPYTG